MDFESPRSQALGCWDGYAAASDLVALSQAPAPTPDFSPDDKFCSYLIFVGLGEDLAKEVLEFWVARIKANYQGDEGRKRLSMNGVCLCARDGLHERLIGIKCPVLWLHVSFSFP